MLVVFIGSLPRIHFGKGNVKYVVKGYDKGYGKG